jgi:hypothetical protein
MSGLEPPKNLYESVQEGFGMLNILLPVGDPLRESLLKIHAAFKKACDGCATPPASEIVPDGTASILQRFANAAFNIKQNLTIPQEWRDSLSGLQIEADRILHLIAASKRKEKEG